MKIKKIILAMLFSIPLSYCANAMNNNPIDIVLGYIQNGQYEEYKDIAETLVENAFTKGTPEVQIRAKILKEELETHRKKELDLQSAENRIYRLNILCGAVEKCPAYDESDPGVYRKTHEVAFDLAQRNAALHVRSENEHVRATVLVLYGALVRKGQALEPARQAALQGLVDESRVVNLAALGLSALLKEKIDFTVDRLSDLLIKKLK